MLCSQVFVMLSIIVSAGASREPTGTFAAAIEPHPSRAPYGQNLRLWLEAANEGDCGVSHLSQRLLAMSKSVKEIDWDTIMENIDWSSINAELNAFFSATDMRISETQKLLDLNQASLSKTPANKDHVHKARVIEIIGSIPKESCKNDPTLRNSLIQNLTGLATEDRRLDPRMVQDVFQDLFPASARKSARSGLSPCFELQHSVVAELRLDLATSAPDKRRILEQEAEKLARVIAKEKSLKTMCQARSADLRELQNHLIQLKRKREEKLLVMSDTEESIDELKRQSEEVVKEISSLADSITQTCEAIVQAEEVDEPGLNASIEKVKLDIGLTQQKKRDLEAALISIGRESEQATAAVLASLEVRTKISAFVQAYLETFRQAVKVPLHEILEFKQPLNRLMQVAEQMEEDSFEYSSEAKLSFEWTSALLTDLNKFCSETALPALSAITSVKVTQVADKNTRDLTPSALCDNHKVRNSEVTMSSLRNHIQEKRVHLAKALKEIALVMADDEDAAASDTVLEKQGDMPGLRQFMAHGPSSIYEDYLKHWRVLGPDTSGEQGGSKIKRGLYLELISKLQHLKHNLKEEAAITKGLVKDLISRIQQLTGVLERLSKDLEVVITKKVKDMEEKAALEKSMALLTARQVGIHDELKGLDTKLEGLDDDIERVERLIVDTHGEIRAALLELGLEESDFEKHYHSLLQELQLMPEPFAVQGLGSTLASRASADVRVFR